MGKSTCSVEGCDQPSRARGWCQKHYDRWTAHGDPLVVHRRGKPASNAGCKVDECGRAEKCKQLCPAHYRRSRLGQPLEVPLRRWSPGDACQVEGCDSPHVSGGHCSMHWQRKYRSGDVGPAERTVAPAGSGYVNPNGYRMIYANGKSIPEHRHVMERILGRPLAAHEHVHHKNGRRADNAPSNLELWTKPQPAGQRPEDLVDWVNANYAEMSAAWLIANRPDLIREALDREGFQ